MNRKQIGSLQTSDEAKAIKFQPLTLEKALELKAKAGKVIPAMFDTKTGKIVFLKDIGSATSAGAEDKENEGAGQTLVPRRK